MYKLYQSNDIFDIVTNTVASFDILSYTIV